MTMPITTDYTFLYSEAQEILSNYDFNNDGKITYDDYWNYKSDKNTASNGNKIEFSSEEIQAWEVIFLVENEEDFQSSSINEDNAITFCEKQLGSPEDPADAKTLKQLQDIGKSLTAYIRNCTNLVETFDEMLKVQEEKLNNLNAQKERVEAKYEEKAQTIKSKEEKLKMAIKDTIADSNSWNEERTKRFNSIIENCIEDYKNGESFRGNSFSAELSMRLFLGGFANASFSKDKIGEVQKCGSSIASLCNDLSNIASDIRNINISLNKEISLFNSIKSNRAASIYFGQKATKLYESGYQRRLDMRKELYDKYHKTCTAKKKHNMNNEQLQMLKQFLANGELKNMPLTDAWAVVKETFDDCGIELRDDGSMVVPKGHGAEAKAVYQEFITQMQELFNIDRVERSGTDEDDDADGDFSMGENNVAAGSGVGKTKRNDPIGFELDNVSYNFISDRNSNGKFDDQSEFLGAKNGWREMKAFDVDKNGIIEGDELAQMQLLAIDNETGQYTFMNAQDIGIDAIDLKSYKASNKRQLNNNILAGTFNITVNGETLKGKQTFDSMKNLNNNFSMMFGSDIADLSADYKENPFVEDFVESVDTSKVKNSVKSDIDAAERKIDSNNEKTTRMINIEAAVKAYNAEIEISNDRKQQKIKEEAIAKEDAEKKKKEENEEVII